MRRRRDGPGNGCGASQLTRLLFVCAGNICRSPTAEAVMRSVVEEAGLRDEIEIDSAGCGAWHVGQSPDQRATTVAGRRGVVLEGTARQVSPADFERYDLILAADRENVADLRSVAPDEAARDKIHLLREYDPGAAGGLEIPDPYYGGEDGYEVVLDMVDAACRGLLDELR